MLFSFASCILLWHYGAPFRSKQASSKKSEVGNYFSLLYGITFQAKTLIGIKT